MPKIFIHQGGVVGIHNSNEELTTTNEDRLALSNSNTAAAGPLNLNLNRGQQGQGQGQEPLLHLNLHDDNNSILQKMMKSPRPTSAPSSNSDDDDDDNDNHNFQKQNLNSSANINSNSSNNNIKMNSRGLLLENNKNNENNVHQQQNSGSCSTSSGSGKVPNKKYGHNRNRNMSLDSNSTTSNYNTLIIHQNNASLLADTWIPASHEFTGEFTGMRDGSNSNYSSPEEDNYLNQDSYNPSAALQEAIYSNTSNNNPNNEMSSNSANVLSEIPRDYLNQLTVLKSLLAQEVNNQQEQDSRNKLLRSASFSKSQPDLTQQSTHQYPNSSSSYSQYSNTNNPISILPSLPSYDTATRNLKMMALQQQGFDPSNSSQNQQQQQNYLTQNQQQQQEEQLPSVQILEILMRENSNLKVELVNARKKIQTIHKLENELTRLQASHAALFESSERRESLERTARVKLSSEVKRLTAFNRELISSSNSLQNLSPFAINTDVETLKNELAKKDLMLNQLINQNKELNNIKERQDIELSAQRSTLQEQRGHIDILENALANSRNNSSREEETRNKQNYLDKITQLQRALNSLQSANEKRELNEKNLRAQLESEISNLKLQLTSMNVNNNEGVTSVVKKTSYSLSPSGSGDNTNGKLSQEAQAQLEILQEKLRCSEEKIQQMNSTVARWENFFSTNPSSNINHHNSSSLSQAQLYQHQQQQQQNYCGGNNLLSNPTTPNSIRGGTPQMQFFPSNSNSNSGSGCLDQQDTSPSGILSYRTTDLEKKIKDLESRLLEKDVMLHVLNASNSYKLQQSFGNSPFTSNSSVASSTICNQNHPPSYRESPNYMGINKNHNQQQNNNNNSTELPPTYANIPLKTRMGGSGSSLAKNSNESLQAGGSHNGSTSSNASNNNNKKSIDEQLKELDSQLLSKDSSGMLQSYAGGGTGLKMQSSGLCCIPTTGFYNPAATTRETGQPSPLLLESLRSRNGNRVNNTTTVNTNTNTTSYSVPNKNSAGKSLPPKANSSKNTTNSNSNSTNSRASSGPPYIQTQTTVGLAGHLISSGERQFNSSSISSSVDSMLNKNNNFKNPTSTSCNSTSQLNIFTPAVSVSMNKLPPVVSSNSNSKSRSLERSLVKNVQDSIPTNTTSSAGKYTQVNYDRCKSLDRRDSKENNTTNNNKEKEKEKKIPSVSSKAAFFGGFLTRRSPSPASKDREKDREKSSRFLFGSNKDKVDKDKANMTNSNSTTASSRTSDSDISISISNSSSTATVQSSTSSGDVDDATKTLLDMQGRSSQRSRITKWSQLEAVEECGSEGSPWVTRRNSAGNESIGFSSSSGRKMFEKEKTPIPTTTLKSPKDYVSDLNESKKLGKIVKTPFGLRYTFGNTPKK